MHLRERFPFDESLACGDWTCLQTFAASADRRTYWVEAGANGGVRFLAHYAPEAEGCGRGAWYVAPRLHAETLVRVDDADVEALLADLRRAADVDAATGAPTPLLDPFAVPGFERQEGNVLPIHAQGWYTRSERVLPLDTPAWAPMARTFDLREGVYLVFPPDADGPETYRLVRRRDYYAFGRAVQATPIARQGDLLVLGREWPGDWTELRAAVAVPPLLVQDHDSVDETGAGRWSVLDDQPITLDRHRIERVPILTEPERQRVPPHPYLRIPAGTIVVTHPEHALLRVPEGATWLTLAPGVSRPFSHGGGVD